VFRQYLLREDHTFHMGLNEMTSHMRKTSEPSANREVLGKVFSSRHGYYQLKLILCCNITYLRQEAICAGVFLVIPVTKTKNGLILTCFKLLIF
jgi:hypothetical protein